MRDEGGRDTLRDGRRDVVVQERRGNANEREETRGESNLQRDHVDLCAEERIEAILTRKACSRYREPFGVRCQYFARRAFGEDF